MKKILQNTKIYVKCEKKKQEKWLKTEQKAEKSALKVRKSTRNNEKKYCTT